MQLYRSLMLLSFGLGSTYWPRLGPVPNLWIGGGEAMGILGGQSKFNLYSVLGGGGQLKLNLIIGPV